MQDEEKIIDVGEADYEETEVDLEAQPEPKEEPKEEVEVQQVEEEAAPVETKKEELDDYSDSVNKRIAKLTRRMREAERQKDEALTYAQSVLRKQKDAESKLSKLQPDFVAVTEESITSGVAAAQAKLAAAREANDLTAEAEALAAISELGYKKAKLAETKIAPVSYTHLTLPTKA